MKQIEENNLIDIDCPSFLNSVVGTFTLGALFCLVTGQDEEAVNIIKKVKDRHELCL